MVELWRSAEDLGATLPIAVFLQRRTIHHLAEMVLDTIRDATSAN